MTEQKLVNQQKNHGGNRNNESTQVIHQSTSEVNKNHRELDLTTASLFSILTFLMHYIESRKIKENLKWLQKTDFTR